MYSLHNGAIRCMMDELKVPWSYSLQSCSLRDGVRRCTMQLLTVCDGVI